MIITKTEAMRVAWLYMKRYRLAQQNGNHVWVQNVGTNEFVRHATKADVIIVNELKKMAI